MVAVGDVQVEKITKQDIVQWGRKDAGKVKDLLWQTKLNEAEVEAAKHVGNMWGAQRFAETLLVIYIIEESDACREKAQRAINQCAELCAGIRSACEPAGIIMSWFGAETKDWPMREVVRVHAVAAEAFCRLAQAFVELKNKSFVSGAYHCRQAFGLYEEALAGLNGSKRCKQDLVLRDSVCFGIGFGRLVASLIPEKFRWFAELLGFHGDREVGMKTLQSVYEAEGLSSVEAGILVAAITFFLEEDTEEALRISLSLLNKWPDSVLLLNFRATLEKHRGHVREAAELLERSVQIASPYPQLAINLGYALSDVYWMTLRFEEAIPLQRTFFNKSNRPNFKAFCGWKLGLALYVTDEARHPETIRQISDIYRRVVTEHVDERESYDRFARRKCQAFLDNPTLSDLDVILLPINWLVELKQFDLALSRLGRAQHLMEKGTPSADQRALYDYLFGAAEVGKENWETGCLHLRRAARAPVEDETWIPPYANLHLLLAALKQQDLASARAHLLAAQTTPSLFDFDGKQRVLTKNAEQKLIKLEKGHPDPSP